MDDMDWAKDFYTKQFQWYSTGIKDDWSIADVDRRRAEAVERLAGSGIKMVLELGCGGGWTAAAIAGNGNTVVAVDIVDDVTEYARCVSEICDGRMTVIHGDFYEIELAEKFDIVCYFDGFGIGSDEEQHRLLRRISSWLNPSGCALIDVFNPWYWAGMSRKMERSQYNDTTNYYEFDFENCRLINWIWLGDDRNQAVNQSLRCYSPADLRLLLESTGLYLQDIETYRTQSYDERVPLQQAMLYLARLVPVR